MSCAEDAFRFKMIETIVGGGLIQTHKLFLVTTEQCNISSRLHLGDEENQAGKSWCTLNYFPKSVLISKFFCLRQAKTFGVKLAISIVVPLSVGAISQ